MLLTQIDGALFVEYNLGMMDHRVGQVELKVNDGGYHIARFIRTGSNASLRIDDHAPHRYQPTGKSMLFWTFLCIGQWLK